MLTPVPLDSNGTKASLVVDFSEVIYLWKFCTGFCAFLRNIWTWCLVKLNCLKPREDLFFWFLIGLLGDRRIQPSEISNSFNFLLLMLLFDFQNFVINRELIALGIWVHLVDMEKYSRLYFFRKIMFVKRSPAWHFSILSHVWTGLAYQRGPEVFGTSWEGT